ncbi:MAG: phosphatase PAP2 family protein, partial [Deltaproteobacteria bacterium]|nr:phosphatase PAP2 family protein [Deltaproteobacteria bacterium]
MLRRIPLHPFEWITIAVLTIAVGGLRVLGLPITAVSVQETVVNMGRVLPAALGLGLALQGYYQWSEKRPLAPYVRAVRSRESILLWLRLWLACWLISFAYFWVKVYVPLLHEGTFDSALWRIDRIVHLGFSPSEVAIGLLSGTPLVGWLDTWYSVWLASIIWSLAFYAASEDLLLRRRVILSCVLLWIAGATGYLLLPALGPVFVFEETWAGVRG